MLELVGVTKGFGGLLAVDHVDMKINKGELVALIGPNGAGKTTLFNLISGIYHCTSGQIIFAEEEITKLSPNRIAKKGISRTFQATTLFSSMTALDNVIMGLHLHSGLAGFSSLIPNLRTRKNLSCANDKARELLNFFKMDKKSYVKSADLSNWDQKILQIVIALACEPKLILLDEPLAGMNLEEIGFTMMMINKVKELGVAILLVEHNMKAVMSYCERVIVINYGRKIAEGHPEEVRHNEDVIRAYLGAPELITES
jgi:branched-chain amino acid transport system ATP-binding protein